MTNYSTDKIDTTVMLGRAKNISEEDGYAKPVGTVPFSPRTSLLTLDQKNSSKDIFISISGLIGRECSSLTCHMFHFAIIYPGAGKTTLATKLGEKMGLPIFYEPVIDNVYLADFYKDPARYSFPLQVGYMDYDVC